MNTSIFVASTTKDLADVRDYVARILVDMGHRVVDFQTDNTFYTNPDANAAQACLDQVKQCQVLILLLDRKYGDLFPGSDKSITRREYETAREQGLKTFVLVRDRTRDAYALYRRNKDKGIDFGPIDVQVLEFYDSISTQDHGNWVQPFSNLQQAGDWIKGQLSALLAETLTKPTFPQEIPAVLLTTVGTPVKQEGLNTLSYLGIAPHDWEWDSTVTRAQLAVMASRMFNQEGTAKLLVGAKAFDDSAYHSASGHIALAENAGWTPFVRGNNFEPERPVSYGEALWAIVCMYGYPAKAMDEAYRIAEHTGILWESLPEPQLRSPARLGPVLTMLNRILFTVGPSGQTLFHTYFDVGLPSIVFSELPSTVVDSPVVTLRGRLSAEPMALFLNDVRIQTDEQDSFVVMYSLKQGVNRLEFYFIDAFGRDTSSVFNFEYRP